jgi:hypothetical protein
MEYGDMFRNEQVPNKTQERAFVDAVMHFQVPQKQGIS